MKEHPVGEHPEVVINIACIVAVFDPDNIPLFHIGDAVFVGIQISKHIPVVYNPGLDLLPFYRRAYFLSIRPEYLNFKKVDPDIIKQTAQVFYA